MGEPDAEEWKAHALRVEFFLGLLTECFGRTVFRINELLWPGPVKHPEGHWIDGTDAVKAVRHDLIRKLFHEDR